MLKSWAVSVLAKTQLQSFNQSAFAVGFGRPDTRHGSSRDALALHIPCPWLAGDPVEEIFSPTLPVGIEHGFTLHTTGDLLLGCSTQPVDDRPEAAARELYRRLLAVSAGRPLYRIWNYVPAINVETDGMENYRAFCAGRGAAFAQAFGDQFKPVLPSASAVGCEGDSLSLVFVAGRAQPQHLENPEQMAAYNYPREHGPQSPSFSRATVARDGQRPLVFISGTAAIKGHVTIAPDRLSEQIDCTFDNLRIIGRAAGVGDDLGRGSAWQRHFKIYLRDPEMLPEVSARFETAFEQSGDRVTYLQSDICRAALNVEIEATLIGR